MLTFFFILAILIEILLPFAIARWSTRRYGVGWRLFSVGMLTFLFSQVLHIPFLTWLTSMFTSGRLPTPPVQYSTIFNAVILGLLAGIFEETFRSLAYRLLKERGNSWGAAVTMGAGHGGLESVIIGLSVLFTLVTMTAVTNGGPNALPFLGQMGQRLHESAGAFWQQQWYMPLLGAVERMGALVMHITLSVLVWLSINRRNALWFVAAILWHAVIDGIAVMMSASGWSPLMMEGVLAVFALLNLAVLYVLRQWVKGQEAAQISANDGELERIL